MAVSSYTLEFVICNLDSPLKFWTKKLTSCNYVNEWKLLLTGTLQVCVVYTNHIFSSPAFFWFGGKQIIPFLSVQVFDLIHTKNQSILCVSHIYLLIYSFKVENYFFTSCSNKPILFLYGIYLTTFTFYQSNYISSSLRSLSFCTPFNEPHGPIEFSS